MGKSWFSVHNSPHTEGNWSRNGIANCIGTRRMPHLFMLPVPGGIQKNWMIMERWIMDRCEHEITYADGFASVSHADIGVCILFWKLAG